jgi:hypothetical protein
LREQSSTSDGLKRQIERMSKGDDLETLYGRISRVGGENARISISEGDVATNKEKGKQCLMGRIGDERR